MLAGHCMACLLLVYSIQYTVYVAIIRCLFVILPFTSFLVFTCAHSLLLFQAHFSVMHLSNLTKGHLLSEILSLCIHLSPWHSSTATKASSIKGTKHKARGSCHSCVKTTVRVSSQQQKISKLSLSVYLVFPVAEHC